VRLTHDGLYAIAVDSATVTVYRIRDGRVMAHTSTHGKAVSLELFDYGYLQAIGREDGYVSITKLVTGRFADKIDSVYERTRQLLRSSTVSSETIASFDMHFRHAIDEVDHTEIAQHQVRHLLADEHACQHTHGDLSAAASLVTDVVE
jgi:hypothetical protein